ncbi:MAG: hypothetical protein JJT76_08700 [Clostridiaceae bacterium]|nr:hypothetical protein [Clostridiaceae bacterium]
MKEDNNKDYDWKNCVYIKSFTKRIEDLEESEKEFEARLTQQERSRDVGKERTDMIYNALDEIKKDIEKINDKIDEIESRPNKLMWGVMATVIASVILTGLSLLGR